MKKIKSNRQRIMGVGIIFISLYFMLYPASIVEAGCCVIGADSCLDTSGTSCSVGTYYANSCNMISTCVEDVPSSKDCSNAGGTCKEGCDVSSGEFPQDGMAQCVAPLDVCCKMESESKKPKPTTSGFQCGAGMEKVAGVCIPTTDSTGLVGGPDDGTTVDMILNSVLDWILGVIGVISMLMLVVSGFQYLLAGGDDKQLETAKRNIKYSIIGLAVALTSFLIIETIDFLISGY